MQNKSRRGSKEGTEDTTVERRVEIQIPKHCWIKIRFDWRNNEKIPEQSAAIERWTLKEPNCCYNLIESKEKIKEPYREIGHRKDEILKDPEEAILIIPTIEGGQDEQKP